MRTAAMHVLISMVKTIMNTSMNMNTSITTTNTEA